MATKSTLNPGDPYIAKYQGQTYRGVVVEVDGKVGLRIVEGNASAQPGSVYTSLSSAGVALTQKKACQGPRFWSLDTSSIADAVVEEPKPKNKGGRPRKVKEEVPPPDSQGGYLAPTEAEEAIAAYRADEEAQEAETAMEASLPSGAAAAASEGDTEEAPEIVREPFQE